jgi:hypothetical protein
MFFLDPDEQSLVSELEAKAPTREQTRERVEALRHIDRNPVVGHYDSASLGPYVRKGARHG